MIAALLVRDMKLLARQWATVLQLWLLPALYALLVAFLDSARTVPAAILLVIFLLWPVQALLSRLWADDIASGAAEQMALSRAPLVLVAALRILLMAEAVLLPAAIATMLALMLGHGAAFTWLDLLSVFLATYALASVTSIIAALTAGTGDASPLALLLLLPLLLPLLILVAVALTLPEQAVAARYLLAAASLVAVPLGAWATATALRHQLSA